MSDNPWHQTDFEVTVRVSKYDPKVEPYLQLMGGDGFEKKSGKMFTMGVLAFDQIMDLVFELADMGVEFRAVGEPTAKVEGITTTVWDRGDEELDGGPVRERRAFEGGVVALSQEFTVRMPSIEDSSDEEIGRFVRRFFSERSNP